jgi:hypothetical protein
MSQDKELYNLPFLVRDMLNFEHGTTFGLRVDYQSLLADQEIYIRGATKSGPFIYHLSTNEQTSPASVNYRIPDMPIWVSIDDAETHVSGTVFVRVALTVNGNILYSLISGYLWNLHTLSWPTSNLKPAMPDIGTELSITGANPAAGAQCSITVPANTLIEIDRIELPLVTAVAVANRRVHIQIFKSSYLIYEGISSVDQAASLTRMYHGEPLGANGAANDDNDIVIPIPQGIKLLTGDTVTTTTTNMQAADDFGVPSIYGRMWPTQ